ncbi:MAG TPA: phosphoribosyltransferase [Solirubrobacteraceae bacterium]|nr:phosphoribosyltransferase [Solirubrobacteraceae bacterium]
MTQGAAVTRFADRRDAGRRLAAPLRSHAGRADVVVLGLPRGGVPVAYEVALALRAPLDVMLVRKLGVPEQEELAFGAIASGGVRVLNADVIAEARLTAGQIDAVTGEQQLELDRRERLYRGDSPPLQLHGLTAIIVDDGLATGATMRAAIQAVRERGGRPLVAVPVGAASTRAAIDHCADGIVCLLTPPRFVAVGNWYGDFGATSDDEVTELLRLAAGR